MPAGLLNCTLLDFGHNDFNILTVRMTQEMRLARAEQRALHAKLNPGRRRTLSIVSF